MHYLGAKITLVLYLAQYYKMEQMLITCSDINAGFPDDILPPEGDYDSRKALFNSINSWARPYGYTFITSKSMKISNG